MNKFQHNLSDIKEEKIGNNILHLKFPTRYLLTSSFCRLSEFYESSDSNLNGKYFTAEELMDKYAEKSGNYTYNLDWSGYNIPDYATKSFLDKFKDLNLKETFLKEKIMPMLNLNKFYIIGTYIECPYWESTFLHELSHALFYVDDEYNLIVKSEVENCPKEQYDKVINKLKTWGYSEDVFIDEIFAYLATNSHENTQKEFDISDFTYSDKWNNIFKEKCKSLNFNIPNNPSNEIYEKRKKEMIKKYGYAAGDGIFFDS